MNKFLNVLINVESFIVGNKVEEPVVKNIIGFTADKPKRKYTRKKSNVKKNTRK
jgi:hypothetical protein